LIEYVKTFLKRQRVFIEYHKTFFKLQRVLIEYLKTFPSLKSLLKSLRILIQYIPLNTHTNKVQFSNINTQNRHINYTNNFSYVKKTKGTEGV